ncbi:MAG: hypothetical protein E5W72_04770 [Mesorhizobium sp.]|uniref:hypothetical protein n=1 Tax=Mesorhizobium sp. TaxID=1871066 RepID=UPI0012186352|nr:hypothetical protein [Mesorhizobium sp.]TIT01146.1 MAG: hypothetical protein E5W87_16330 [Mesorhizobium sp.]TIT54208.1 MAG: hypothetical protein E5W72_04770 [Mesorhizobium sp.]TKD45730.1 MAG: hypothetical protein E5W98_12615 [Mesorhizobium sp.]
MAALPEIASSSPLALLAKIARQLCASFRLSASPALLMAVGCFAINHVRIRQARTLQYKATPEYARHQVI